MLFYSNAFNLINWFENGVDSSTLMYIQNIMLAKIHANFLNGPNVDLYIRFNQFSAVDYGFGIGWELGFSRVDEETGEDGSVIKTLVLLNGERYRITSSADGDVSLQYKQTLVFKVVKKGDVYTIYNKNGLVETVDNGRTVKITDRNGTSISIVWNEDGSFSINNDDGSALVKTSILSDENKTTHSVTTPRGTIDYVVQPLDGNLMALAEVNDTNPDRRLFSMEYLSHNDKYLAIKKFISSLSFYQCENISYENLKCPPGLNVNVLGVTSVNSFFCQFIRTPMYLNTIYRFERSNYLGYGVVAQWNPDADNMEKMDAAMTFISSAEIKNRRKIWRYYNKFYLETKTERTPAPKKRRKHDEYEYQLNLGEGIAEQASTFMLPVKVSQVVTIEGEDGVIKTIRKVSTHRYDAFSNETHVANAEGQLLDIVYFDAQGESDGDVLLCPADPDGFVNYIKSKTLSSCAVSNGPAKKIWQYTYAQITGCSLVLVSSEKFSINHDGDRKPSSSVLHKMDFEYLDAATDCPGRVKKVISNMATLKTTCYGLPVLTYIPTTENFTYLVDNESNTEIISRNLTGFDGNATTRSIKRNGKTADILESSDENGVKTVYAYNSIGDVVKSVYAAGSLYEITEVVVYDPDDSTIVVASTGKKYKEIRKFNAAGNVIREQVSITDAVQEEKIFLLAAYHYNMLGQLASSIEYDYTDDNGFIVKKTSSLWNVYDELTSRTYPGQRVDTYVYDEDLDLESSGTIAVSHQPGDVKTIDFSNEFGKLLKKVQYCIGEKTPDATDVFSYDAFWNVRRHEQSDKLPVEYTYDGFDRQITQKKSTVQTKVTTYAAHSRSLLVCRVEINGVVTGEKTYDGLDRIVRTKIGAAVSDYTYAGSALYDKPGSIVTQGGWITAYEYIAEIGKTSRRTKRRNAPGSPIRTMRTFSYNASSWLLEKSTNTLYKNIGVVKQTVFLQEFSYDKFNNVAGEKAEWGDSIYGGYQETIKSSPRGLPYYVMMKLYDGNVIIKYNVYNQDGELASAYYHLNDVMLSRSSIERNNYHDIARINSSVLLGGDIYTDLYQYKEYYKKYNLVREIGYGEKFEKKNFPVLVCKSVYDKQRRLERMDFTYSATSTYSWNERYSYTPFASTLRRWKRVGDMVYYDQYDKKVTDQKFTYDAFDNISQVISNIEGVTNTSTYTHENTYQLKQIKNVNALEELGIPETIDFTSDLDGNTLSQRYKIKGKQKLTEYFYDGEDEAFRTRVIVGNKVSQRHYFYDPTGRQVRHAQESEGFVGEIFYLFHGEEVMLSLRAPSYSDKNFSGFTLFHRIEGQVMFLTVYTGSREEIKVCPCFDMPNGNLIVQGTPFISLAGRDKKSNKPIYHAYYEMDINGQNAYGLAYRLKKNILTLRGASPIAPGIKPQKAVPDH